MPSRCILSSAVAVLAAAVVTSCAARRQYITLNIAPPRTGAVSPSPDCPPPGVVAPATPRASHYSRYGCYLQTGFIDLQAGMRLKVVRPVTPGGEPLKNEVASQQGLDLTVKTNALGVDTRYWSVLEAAPIAETGFDPSITHYRLFLLARDLDSTRKITLIGSASKAGLDAATASLDRYCAAAPRPPCLAVTPGMVIGAEIPIVVAGRRAYVPIGASLREALPNPPPPPDRLRLERWSPTHRRKLPVRLLPPGSTPEALLSIPLNGGDTISWQ